MSTRAQLLALNDELRRLKAGGQRGVSVTEEGLAQLREAVTLAQTEITNESIPQLAPVVTMSQRKSQSVDRPPKPSGAALPTLPELKLPEGDKQTRWNCLRDLVLNDSVCRARVYP